MGNKISSSSDVLVGELSRLSKFCHSFTTSCDADLSFQRFWHLENTLLRLARQEAALASSARLVAEELLPAGLLLHVLLVYPISSLLFLDCLYFSLLRILNFLTVCFLYRKTLRNLVACGRRNLFDSSLLISSFVASSQSDLVEFDFCFGSIFSKRDSVAFLGLLGDDAVVPQAILVEDALAICTWLALRGVWRPKHLDIGDLVLFLVWYS
mmetsp:Transcript_104376/g.164710  ORF Transcript_104376/g.164710 Transcript_104376/m.164710 type:complete len:211 (+) Transcript_104376:42-674(+)